MPSCVREPKAGVIIRARRRFDRSRGEIGAPQCRQFIAFVVTCACSLHIALGPLRQPPKGADDYVLFLGSGGRLSGSNGDFMSEFSVTYLC